MSFPARLHVLLAQEAPVGLVIRRGPSRHVATILWDRRTDEFQLGQWLKGRIYERRCDLSPDGKYLLYFAMNGRWQSEARGSWTAISRVPYLKALVMLPKGDCWHGGGLWTSTTRYWLNGGSGHSIMRDSNEVQRDESYTPPENFGGECPGVYYPRLLRDRWQLVERHRGHAWTGESWYVFEKPLAYGWTLRKTAHASVYSPVGRGCYWDTHELIQRGAGITSDYSEWEWADVGRDRVVWAERGKLCAGRIAPEGLVDTVELYDFNPMVFEPIVAPY